MMRKISAACLPFFLATPLASLQAAPLSSPIQLDVDATNIDQRIFQVHETIPAEPGKLRLYYPEWLPGKHRPAGQIDKLAGLKITANGQVLPWKRDQYDVYAFEVTVPEGVNAVDAEFQFLSPLSSDQGRVVVTPAMLNLQWDQTVLYPAGYTSAEIPVDASVTLPQGWSYAAALTPDHKDGNKVSFDTISLENLIDSPMYAGKYYRRIALDGESKQPVYLNVFADEAKDLAATDAEIKPHKALVAQADKLYGARHYNHYDFLLALTDQLGGIGLEHHRSSENSAKTGYFTNWDQNWLSRGLLPHEYNHSWNGKFRRGEDLATPNYNVPMGDSLLWVYEGQTQFYGYVLAARSGMWSMEQARDMLSLVAATYDRGRPGLSWRTLHDTTNDPTIAARAPLAYRSYQMSEDYYNGGQMMWLEVNAKISEMTHGRRSLDDFAKAFFGMDNGAWSVKTYTFDDVVATLNGIVPFDWAGFLRERLDGHGSLIGGLEASGWELIYTDTPNEATKATEKARKSTDLTYSLGLSINDKGKITDVLWDGPAFKAGLAPQMEITAVNGEEINGERLKAAVSAARDGKDPIQLMIKVGDRFETRNIDYHGGLQYPHLQRISGTKDLLTKLYSPR